MKPLRELAKGYRRIVDKFGTPWIVREFYYCAEKHAPNECFANAKPAEEPVREGERVVVEVPDGHMGASGEVVAIIETDGGAAIEVLLDGETRHRQYRHSGLRREREDERPAEPQPEPPPVHMTVALVDGRIQVNLDPVEGGGA